MQPTRSLVLEATIFTPAQLAVPEAPQIALAGRSNVGKSSLVNCLAGRKQLAKISSTPGKTRSLNFYRVEPSGYYLVDLPGYGYARCAQTERQKWAGLINSYLDKAAGLRAVVALLDSRLAPQRLDLELVAYLRQRAIPILAVLTKADKINQRERSRRQAEWRDLLRTPESPILFSSQTGLGREALWARLDSLALG